MADVAVDSAVANYTHCGLSRGGPVWTTASIGYVVYIDSTGDAVYSKTSDGGDNWSAATSIDATSVSGLDIWFDKWTPGDSGTKIHIWWMESDTDDVHYRSLDTSSDTLGTDITVFDGASFDALSFFRNDSEISGTKAVGGNLYVQFWGDADGERGFYRSVDSGANWTSRTDGADGNVVDYVICLPDDDSADSQDIVMLYWDVSATEISIKKYDDSDGAGGSWAETSVSAGMSYSLTYLQWGAVVRHSDGHVLLAAWSVEDQATADLKVWDITLTTPTITGKTDVITDSDDCICAALFIDQNNDDLYCAYAGMDDGSQTAGALLQVHYSKSDDGAATWGGETTYQANTADDERWIGAGHSTPGAAAGRFEPMFFNDDLNDIYVNKDNSVEITVSVGAIASQRLKSGTGR
jgi:hypothetical protein